ncbi:MAG: ferredoxin [Pseudomonadota bacterium]
MDLTVRLAPHGLWPLGGFYPEADDAVPRRTQTLVLIAPRDADFWPVFSASDEYADGAPHPLDRWSRRVIGRIACDLRAKALFPFTGPPWHPFLRWARQTGSVHASPVGMLVDASMGLFVSIRGAIALKRRIALPAPVPAPCATCADRPCLTACPVGALGADGYQVDTCRAFIGSDPHATCLDTGCAVRRACPVSADWGRSPAQSAFHMRAFQG